MYACVLYVRTYVGSQQMSSCNVHILDYPTYHSYVHTIHNLHTIPTHSTNVQILLLLSATTQRKREYTHLIGLTYI